MLCANSGRVVVGAALFIILTYGRLLWWRGAERRRSPKRPHRRLGHPNRHRLLLRRRSPPALRTALALQAHRAAVDSIHPWGSTVDIEADSGRGGPAYGRSSRNTSGGRLILHVVAARGVHPRTHRLRHQRGPAAARARRRPARASASRRPVRAARGPARRRRGRPHAGLRTSAPRALWRAPRGRSRRGRAMRLPGRGVQRSRYGAGRSSTGGVGASIPVTLRGWQRQPPRGLLPPERGGQAAPVRAPSSSPSTLGCLPTRCRPAGQSGPGPVPGVPPIRSSRGPLGHASRGHPARRRHRPVVRFLRCGWVRWNEEQHGRLGKSGITARPYGSQDAPEVPVATPRLGGATLTPFTACGRQAPSGPNESGPGTGHGQTGSRSPPVIRRSSSAVVGKTVRGVPAAAQRRGYSVRAVSTTVGSVCGWPTGETPPIACPVA